MLSMNKIIAIDFDGTCVSFDYPRIGKDIGSVPVLKELVNKGHRLILFTMRSHKIDEDTSEWEFTSLEQAINWFQYNGIPLYGINSNPTQHTWTSSPKPYAHLYIDDAALGIPLIYEIDNKGKELRPYVDWIKVRELLVQQEYL